MKKYYLFLLFIPLLFFVGIASAQPTTLWEYFTSNQVNLPTVLEREPIAREAGIENYTGSSEQNDILLDFLLYERALTFGAVGQVASRFKTTLTQSLTETMSSSTDITISNVALVTGENLTASDVGDFTVYTINPGVGNEEKIVCSSFSATSTKLVGCRRGLSYTGSIHSRTENVKTHGPGELIIISDDFAFFKSEVGFLEGVNAWTGNDWITGTWGFNVVPTTTDTCTADTEFCPKTYIDNVANQGASTSTESVGGLVELATQIEAASTTATTSDKPLVLQAQHVTSTPAANVGLHIPMAENDGKLNLSWLDLSETWAFTGTQSFSGNATSTGTFEFDGLAQFDSTVLLNQGYSKTFTCGETISGHQAVYSSATSSRVLLTDIDNASSSVPYIGIALDECDTGNTTNVQIGGIYTSSTASFTIDDIIYASSTPGFISGSIPLNPSTQVETIIGRAISTTDINLDEEFGEQYITQASDGGNDVIEDVPAWARKAVVSLSCTTTDGPTGTDQSDGVIYRYGKTVFDFQNEQDATSGDCNATATWSGNTITCAFSGNADAVACDAYYFR